MRFISNSVVDTEAVAFHLARTWPAGCCVGLTGELGAGKTQFVRGVVRSLGGDPLGVSSPTFVLLQVYDCRCVKVFHLDAYRVRGGEDFESIGFAELLQQNGIVIVEWPARVRGALPAGWIEVKIVATGETTRLIEVPDDVRTPRAI